jgi:hypothetical protein
VITQVTLNVVYNVALVLDSLSKLSVNAVIATGKREFERIFEAAKDDPTVEIRSWSDSI